jgi:hypothetical protein
MTTATVASFIIIRSVVVVAMAKHETSCFGHITATLTGDDERMLRVGINHLEFLFMFS